MLTYVIVDSPGIGRVVAGGNLHPCPEGTSLHDYISNTVVPDIREVLRDEFPHCLAYVHSDGERIASVSVLG